MAIATNVEGKKKAQMPLIEAFEQGIRQIISIPSFDSPEEKSISRRPYIFNIQYIFMC